MAACLRNVNFGRRSNTVAILRSFVRYSYEQRRQTTTERVVESSAVQDEIVIPYRIKRGPTDILEALASTVSRDYAAPHYKFHDDPYLIPTSNPAKRSYALSKESGRKAAQWIRDQHSEHFPEGFDEPKIKAFTPKEIYSMDNDVTAETLRNCIFEVDVSNAITVYKNLSSKNIEIDREVLQELLELVCFYNCENAPDEEYIEEMWFKGMSSKDARKSWKGAELVDELINKLDLKDWRVHATVIRGLAKYLQSERAWNLYKKMKEQQLPIDVGTYNSLIHIIYYLRETFDTRWQLVEELLNEMKNNKVKPDLGTFNAVLDTLSRSGSWKDAKRYSLQILAEMKALGIEPSLGSYYYLLVIFCRERGPISTILYEIMTCLKNKELHVRDPKDVFFFATAMDVCHTHLQDKELAYTVDALLHHANNRVLIGDSLKEAIYFQHFFKLLCETENIDILFTYYDKLVPNVYTPEPTVMLKMLRTVELSASFQHILQLWSDIVTFGHLRENIIETVLNIMANGSVDDELQSKFSNIALFIKELVDGQRPVRGPPEIQWTGHMLGNIMLLFLKAGQYDLAWNVLEKVKVQQHRISGPLTIEPMEIFVKKAVESQDIVKALTCVEYMADSGYIQASDYAQEILAKLDLDERQKEMVKTFISIKAIEQLDQSE